MRGLDGDEAPRQAAEAVRMTESRLPVSVVPLVLPVANQVVTAIHRHHPPIPAGFAWFCVGAVVAGDLCGVAIAGRPTNRNNDDGQTVEVLRVATDGTANVPSALLGSCARAARALGARRILTYTLDTESGSSLRGAGWTLEKVGIQSCWTTPTPGRIPGVHRAHSDTPKARWALDIKDPEPEFTNRWQEAASVELSGQGALDFGATL
jgi:hypothetical protein